MNITNLRKEMEEGLVGNILPFWLNKMTDKANGAFMAVSREPES